MIFRTKCPECKGAGVFDATPRVGNGWWEHGPDYYAEECTYCDGTGLDPDRWQKVERRKVKLRLKIQW